MSTGHRNRLWEKFRESGLRNGFFHPYEKLELLLTCALPRKDTKPIAKALLERFKTIDEVIRAPTKELMDVAGVGERAALVLRLFGEVALVTSEEELEREAMGPEHMKRYLMHELAWEESEYFMAVYLNSRNHLLGKTRLFRGTVNRTQVFPREVAREALNHNAVGCVVAHNHPSGLLEASGEDTRLTKVLARTLKTVDVRLLDHLIVTRTGVLSMYQQGLFKV